MSDVAHSPTPEARPAGPTTEPTGPAPPDTAVATERMAPVPPVPPAPRPSGSGPGGGRDPGEVRRRRTLIAVLVVLVLLAAAAVALVVANDDDGGTPATSTATTEEPSATTTTAPTTASTAPTTAPTTAPPVDTSTAVFPAAGARYDDPVDVARAFAVDYVGFTDPVVGDFMQGDARSGEVEVRPMATGPVTTVFVRQLGTDGSWWVLGSATGNIAVDTPATGDRITSPVTVSGSAVAFEGNVAVEVRADGTATPIGTGYVTGGGDQMRPFEGSIAFTSPGQGYGSLMFVTHSAENGQVWEAATMRVRF
jgi:hypothetical protein